MLGLVYLALFVLVRSEDLLGVNYSFDVDYYTNFNSKKCDNKIMWRLVSYEFIRIKPPYNGDKAVQAIGESCASSFPIIFVGGTLEFNVYSQDISQMYNLRIEVFDEDDLCISSYKHRPGEDFEPGWRIISLKIDKHVKGYIRLRGNSLNKILLIDSFRYTPNDTATYADKRFIRSVPDAVEDDLIFEYKTYNRNEDDKSESSGDDENNTEEPPSTDQPVSEPQGRDTFWNPFTISLVSFGVVIAVALVTVGAYHYGKVRAGNQPVLFVDEEPPRTITIPRVTARSNRSSPTTFNY